MKIKKKKTEAQQLIQKCIEDIQIQLNVANTKLKEQQNNINNPMNNTNEPIDYTEMIKVLERKLKMFGSTINYVGQVKQFLQVHDL